jgi:hypothetical protein
LNGLGFRASRTNLYRLITLHNGIKQDSDPGIFPGIRVFNPVSFCPRSGDSDSTYFKVRIKTLYMLQKTTIPHLLLFSSVFLFSFRNINLESLAPKPAYPFIVNHEKMETDTGGRAVNIDSAQACINRFPAYMAQFGFTNPGGQSVNIKIKKSAMLTSGESFNAQNLQNWLSATIAQYAAAGKTLVINVQLGVYDMNYLNTYQTDAAKRSANNGRIAIFLMPADASTGTVVRALVAQPDGSGGTGSGGGTGYDLGGLQP